MHIEKNVFNNMFNTVMDEKGKTKDNAKAREDLKTICKRPELELQCRNDKIFKPKVAYVLTSYQVKEARRWIKDLRFLDRYVSNITHCVNIEEGKMYGMKSHDFHVF